ncbi:SUKH-4 family immunity protein [Streptomyces sp. NBC_01537]|uniref:SUKH-4 family immunity protein n=1 Tax=Streptomyces sp. NBC_01537 TaxID=2903896 RepID=UPI00386D2AF2
MRTDRQGSRTPPEDHEIARMLAPVAAGELLVPYPGMWAHPPYRPRAGRPVIAHDPGVTVIVVDRDSGTVLLLDEDGESVPNSSPAMLVECARRYTAAVRTPDTDDDRWEAIGRYLLAQIRAIDPAAADGESFWAVAAEEVGGPRPSGPRCSHPTSGDGSPRRPT